MSMQTTKKQTTKKIFITGATDGLGLASAIRLAGEGHTILLHGRNPEKLERVASRISSFGSVAKTYLADLSDLNQVKSMAEAIARDHDHLDVLINNAGVFKTQSPKTRSGLDIRFVVNTIAPYLLFQQLGSLLKVSSRVINLSSAAQAPVDLEALQGRQDVADMPAYAQSKLALTMWTAAMPKQLGNDAPVLVSVNPGSMLATKMVQEAFGVSGSDLGVGVDILVRAALSDEFAAASGRYFDNDALCFADPHPDALDPEKNLRVIQVIETILKD